MKKEMTVDAILSSMKDHEKQKIGNVVIVKENGRFHAKAPHAIIHNASHSFTVSFVLNCKE